MSDQSATFIKIPLIRKQESDIIKIMQISLSRGITASYSINRKRLIAVFFTMDKWGWTVEKAQNWIDRHNERLQKTNDLLPLSKELRCAYDEILLCKMSKASVVEIKCRKCNTVNRYTQGTSFYQEPSKKFVEYFWS